MSDARGLRSGASEKSICESGRAARRSSSRRCLSVTGVVKSALAGTRLSCGDDADFFFTMWFLACVNYQQDRDAAGAADGMPALVFVHHAIPVGDNIWILEDPCRHFKRNAMLPTVDAILILIPRENHVYLQKCSTSPAGFRRRDGESSGRRHQASLFDFRLHGARRQDADSLPQRHRFLGRLMLSKCMIRLTSTPCARRKRSSSRTVTRRAEGASPKRHP